MVVRAWQSWLHGCGFASEYVILSITITWTWRHLQPVTVTTVFAEAEAEHAISNVQLKAQQYANIHISCRTRVVQSCTCDMEKGWLVRRDARHQTPLVDTHLQS